jgi:hypothetical protein
LTVVEWTRLPDAALTVRTYVPAGVVALVVIFSVEFPFPSGIDGGLKTYPAPAGSPLTLRSTFPVNPCSAATFTV